jgi:hypothetical protein
MELELSFAIIVDTGSNVAPALRSLLGEQSPISEGDLLGCQQLAARTSDFRGGMVESRAGGPVASTGFFRQGRFRPPDTGAESWRQQCVPHSHCADCIRTLRCLPHPLALGLSAFGHPPSAFSSPTPSAPRALGTGRTMPKSSRCLSAVIGCGIGSRMHAQFPSRPWRVGSAAEKVLIWMLKPESDLSAVPESGFGGPPSGPGPESPGRTKPFRAPISERPRPGTLPPALRPPSARPSAAVGPLSAAPGP